MLHLRIFRPKFNAFINTFIIAESFLFSPYFALSPIFGLYVTKQIKNGTIENAALAYTIYLISRVVIELISGELLKKTENSTKIKVVIIGILITSLAFIGFSIATEIYQAFLSYGLIGVGLGIASPPKNTLFSLYLDKNKETEEWAVYDGAVFLVAAIATAIGGVVAGNFGFKIFFHLGALITGLAAAPYLYFLYSHKSINKAKSSRNI